MADLRVDAKAIERARIQLEIGQIRFNKQSAEFRRLQLVHELNQIDENIKAMDETIAEKETELKELDS